MHDSRVVSFCGEEVGKRGESKEPARRRPSIKIGGQALRNGTRGFNKSVETCESAENELAIRRKEKPRREGDLAGLFGDAKYYCCCCCSCCCDWFCCFAISALVASVGTAVPGFW